MYDQIPAIYTHLEKVSEKLLDEFPVIAEDEQEDELSALLGDQIAKTEDKTLDLPLAKEITKPENIGKARELLVDILETEKQLKKDSKGANYLITCCAKAHSQLQAAVADLKAETSTTGVISQLDSIDELVNKIRDFVAKNA